MNAHAPCARANLGVQAQCQPQAGASLREAAGTRADRDPLTPALSPAGGEGNDLTRPRPDPRPSTLTADLDHRPSTPQSLAQSAPRAALRHARTPSVIASATRSWYAGVASFRASAAFETNPTSTSTAGMRAPART